MYHEIWRFTMKADKKVIESITVASLAMALAITAG